MGCNSSSKQPPPPPPTGTDVSTGEEGAAPESVPDNPNAESMRVSQRFKFKDASNAIIAARHLQLSTLPHHLSTKFTKKEQATLSLRFASHSNKDLHLSVAGLSKALTLPHQHIHEIISATDIEVEERDSSSSSSSSWKGDAKIDDLFARQIHQCFVATGTSGQAAGIKVEYEDFAQKVATLTKGDKEDKINFMFDVYDIRRGEKKLKKKEAKEEEKEEKEVEEKKEEKKEEEDEEDEEGISFTDMCNMTISMLHMGCNDPEIKNDLKRLSIDWIGLVSQEETLKSVVREWIRETFGFGGGGGGGGGGQKVTRLEFHRWMCTLQDMDGDSIFHKKTTEEEEEVEEEEEERTTDSNAVPSGRRRVPVPAEEEEELLENTDQQSQQEVIDQIDWNEGDGEDSGEEDEEEPTTSTAENNMHQSAGGTGYI